MTKRKRHYDTVETIDGAMIQHGPMNNRIYLIKIDDADSERLIGELQKMAAENEYTKIFAKVPASRVRPFLSAGFEYEARVPRYFDDDEDALMVSQFLDDARRDEKDPAHIQNVMNLCKERLGNKSSQKTLPEGSVIRRCATDDARDMSDIYHAVFKTYPFPIDDPAYIEKTMNSHVEYYGVEIDGTLVSLASSEIDKANKAAEMTDFATLPQWRGNGFASLLLKKMEDEMKDRGMRTLFTISRAVSPGINITFARRGYTYGGRLVNNTDIGGQIESMNVWHKSL